jgi:hypothetical protein
MKSVSSMFALGLLVNLFALPGVALAHERGVFEIGGGYYQFVVGSQDEPIVVDDKTGVSLQVQKLASSTSESGTPVTGLEKSLKVEIQAMGQKRTQDMTAVWGKPGAYDSLFYPTAATTYSYRVFGSIEGALVDLTFTCHSGAHVMGGEADKTKKDMGQGVVRHMQAGMFSCPMAKAELGFPKRSSDIASLSAQVASDRAALRRVSREFYFVEIALGLLVIALAAVYRQQRKKPLV